jgi:CrcB protein
MATLYVGIGGLLGVLGRYGISRLTLHHHGLLWSTVAINIAGSFLLGMLVAAGFTTFSTFSVQIVLETDAGETGTAALYLTASVIGGIAAAAAGYAIGRAYS